MSQVIDHKLGNGNTIHYKQRNGTFYHVAMSFSDGRVEHRETPEQLVDWLESARQAGTRLRFFLGDANGRDWMEEHDVCGTIGRSTGSIKIPLVIRRANSSGGGGLLDNCIVRLMIGRREVYRQANYQPPVLRVRPILADEVCGKENLMALGYTHAVDREVNGSWTNQANFKSERKAKNYMAFMLGERQRP